MARKLEVEFIGDAASLQRAFEKANKSTRKFGKETTSVFGRVSSRGGASMVMLGRGAAAAAAGVAVAGTAAVGAGKKLLDLASDAEETASKFKTVFGKQTARATKQLNAFSQATGTSRFELKEQAAQFQALIRPMGLSTKNAAAMSVGMTKLATDLASFNNSSVQEAMTALQSGLVGEAEPLRRFGVQLSAARVEAFAYAEGIAKQGAELTAAQKAQAAYGIILEDTKLAQGDAERTSGSFANQLKRFKATVTDVATEMGMKLLPAANKALNGVNSFIRGMREGTGAGGQFVTTVKTVASSVASTASAIRSFVSSTTGLVAIGAVVGGLTARFVALQGVMVVGKVIAFANAIKGAGGAMAILSGAIKANPIGLIATAIGAAAGALGVFALKSSNAEISTRELTDALRAQRDALREVRDIDIDVAQRKANVMSANVAVAQAEERLREVRKSGTASAIDIQAAEADLKQTRVAQKRAQRELSRAEEDSQRKRQDAKTVTEDLSAKTKKAVEERRKEIKAIDDQVRAITVQRVRLGGSAEVAEMAAKETEELRKKQQALREEIARLNSGLTRSTGRELINGLITGIRDRQWALKHELDTTIEGAVTDVRQKLGIRSPSKVFAEIGEQIGAGLAEGVANTRGRVERGLNDGLLFPLDAAIRRLEERRERLQNRWARFDARVQRRGLLEQIQVARSQPAMGGGGGRSGRGGLPVVEGGRFLQSLGLQVGESKFFGGVTTNRHKHYPNDHYSGNSIDVNFPGGGPAELSRLQAALGKLRRMFGDAVNAVIEDAGTANQHLHATFQGGPGRKGRAAVSKMAGLAKGKFSLQDLANLWVAAGGDPKHAGIMARVAMAESGGSPSARNPSGATGLWQILGKPFAGDATDPFTNARMAVSKFKAAGGLAPWEASRHAWEKFLGNPGVSANGKGFSGRVRGGDGGSIQDATRALQDFDREAKRAQKLAKIEAKITGLDRVRAFKDAIGEVRSQIADKLNQAVDKFRDNWERTVGRTIDKANQAALGGFDQQTQALVANTAAAKRLAALRGQEAQDAAAAEDRANQEALQSALASGDQREIEEARRQIAATARAREIASLEQQVAQETARIEEQRATERETLEEQMAEDRQKRMDADVKAFEQAEKDKFKGLVASLNAQTMSYATFVAKVQPMLASIGQTFDPTAAQEAAIVARGGLNKTQQRWLTVFMATHGGLTPQEYNAAFKAGTAPAITNLPSFDGGGVVPGRVGAPVPILAHGGEGVFTPEQMAAGAGKYDALVRIENYNVYAAHDERKVARDLAWDLQLEGLTA